MFVGGGLLTLLLMIALMFLGVDPMQVARMAPEMAGPAPKQAPGKPVNDELSQFVRVVLADNEDVWSRLFPQVFGGRYAPPTLVLFQGQVRSACGMASAAAALRYIMGYSVRASTIAMPQNWFAANQSNVQPVGRRCRFTSKALRAPY